MVDTVSVQDVAEKALSLYQKGYNSSQALLFAFSDRTGLDMNTALKTASAFGYGIGTAQSTCGIVTGAAMVIGNYFYCDKDMYHCRQLIFEKTQTFIKTFEKKYKSINCLDLVGVDFHEPGGLLKVRKEQVFETTCQKMISFACVVLEKILSEDS